MNRAPWIFRLHQLLAWFGLEWSCHAHHPDDRHWCVCYKWHEGDHFYFESAVTEDLKTGVRVVLWPQ